MKLQDTIDIAIHEYRESKAYKHDLAKASYDALLELMTVFCRPIKLHVKDFPQINIACFKPLWDLEAVEAPGDTKESSGDSPDYSPSLPTLFT